MSTVRDDGYARVAELYDHMVPYATRGDIPFWVEAARQARGAVLEIGCGTGRVLIPTARAGVSITGLDRSAAMLDVCRDRLAREPDDVRSHATLVEGDMRAFDLPGRFSLATLPFRCFQHLVTVDEQVACLAAIARHVVPGGRLILDLFNPSLDVLATRPEGVVVAEEPAFTLADGRRVVRRHRIAFHDRFAQVNHVEHLYDVTYPDGREEHHVHAFEMRYLFRFEAEHLLRRCGFEVERVLSGFDGREYGSHYPGELVLSARRITA